MKLQIAPEITRKPQTITNTLPADIVDRLKEYAKTIGSVDYTLAQILDQVLPEVKKSKQAKGASA